MTAGVIRTGVTMILDDYLDTEKGQTLHDRAALRWAGSYEKDLGQFLHKYLDRDWTSPDRYTKL